LGRSSQAPLKTKGGKKLAPTGRQEEQKKGEKKILIVVRTIAEKSKKKLQVPPRGRHEEIVQTPLRKGKQGGGRHSSCGWGLGGLFGGGTGAARGTKSLWTNGKEETEDLKKKEDKSFLPRWKGGGGNLAKQFKSKRSKAPKKKKKPSEK